VFIYGLINCLGITLNAFEAHVHSEFFYCKPKLNDVVELLKPHNASRQTSEREQSMTTMELTGSKVNRISDLVS